MMRCAWAARGTIAPKRDEVKSGKPRRAGILQET